MIYLLLILIPFMYCGGFVAGEINTSNNSATVVEQPEQTESAAQKIAETSYCFRFTWLGPQYTPDSEYKNATCADKLKGAKGVPCESPLVVTNNSYIPDTDYMWNEYKDQPLKVACRLAAGDVCAKYTYFYNGAVENITYLCTKVRIENEDAVTSGCYSEINDGRMVQVCVCESRAGHTPCNAAVKVTTDFIAIILKILMFGFLAYL